MAGGGTGRKVKEMSKIVSVLSVLAELDKTVKTTGDNVMLEFACEADCGRMRAYSGNTVIGDWAATVPGEAAGLWVIVTPEQIRAARKHVKQLRKAAKIERDERQARWLQRRDREAAKGKRMRTRMPYKIRGNWDAIVAPIREGAENGYETVTGTISGWRLGEWRLDTYPHWVV